jgi:hypothetical protein
VSNDHVFHLVESHAWLVLTKIHQECKKFMIVLKRTSFTFFWLRVRTRKFNAQIAMQHEINGCQGKIKPPMNTKSSRPCRINFFFFLLAHMFLSRQFPVAKIINPHSTRKRKKTNEELIKKGSKNHKDGCKALCMACSVRCCGNAFCVGGHVLESGPGQEESRRNHSN